MARPPVRALARSIAVALLFCASGARAEEDEGLAAPRIAFIPTAGIGIGGFTSQLPRFPSLIGFSISQAELSYEDGKWGGFARGAFLSSGDDGRWTAPVLALGASYRLQGDGEERWGFVTRGGLLYQRWHANTAGCPVPFFFPDNCKDFTPAPLAGHVDTTTPAAVATIDTMGLLVGARAEAPITGAFIAFGAELSTTVDLSQSSPGLVWNGQLTIAFGLRNHQVGDQPARRPGEPMRYQRPRGSPF